MGLTLSIKPNSKIQLKRRSLKSVSRCVKYVILLILFEILVFWKYPLTDMSVTIISKCKEKNNSTKESDEVNKCELPILPIFPVYFQRDWIRGYQPNCSYHEKVADLRGGKELILRKKFQKANCCLHEIVRGDTDSKFTLSACEKVNKSINIGKKELFLVRCKDSDQISYDFNIQMKANVARKLNHWKKIPTKDRPISVLVLGIDSCSRAHAHRSFVKSMRHMKTELGFQEFSLFHSLAPSTLTNLMGFLIGLSRGQVRRLCSPGWRNYFSTCPFIWKKFSDFNYITMFMEDGVQSFNWGGQSGFKEQPTDYYPHHLFNSLARERSSQFKRHLLKTNRSKIEENTEEEVEFSQCLSSEMLQDFMLRYTQNVLKKFAEYPLFTLTWFTHPFHQYISSHRYSDERLLTFLKFLQNSPTILKSTLIVLLSDHGDRVTNFFSHRIGSFIERGNPVFLVRPPDFLVEKNPQLKNILRHNSKLLTTPYDLHHTFLHLIHMANKKNLQSFSPSWQNRSSLFVPFNKSRTCEEVSIDPSVCLCNVKYDEYNLNVNPMIETLVNPHLAGFVINSLNEIIDKSKYRHLCERIAKRRYSKAQKLSETPDFVEHVVSLGAYGKYRNYSRFDVRVRSYLNVTILPVSNGTEKSKNKTSNSNRNLPVPTMEFLGYFRTSRYANQSWCIGYDTDFDKQMKELCFCKHQINTWP